MTKSKMLEYARRYEKMPIHSGIFDVYKRPSQDKINAYYAICDDYINQINSGYNLGAYPKIITHNSQNFTVGYWLYGDEPYMLIFVVITKNYIYRYCDISEELEIIKR